MGGARKGDTLVSSLGGLVNTEGGIGSSEDWNQGGEG